MTSKELLRRILVFVMVFAFVAAFFSTALASFSVFFVFRTNLPLKKYLDTISQLPAAIPGSLFGLALSIFASRLHFHASIFLIILAMTVSFLPFSFSV